MKSVKKLFTEIVISSLLLIFLDSLITTIFFFSFFMLLFHFIGLKLIYAVYPSIIFFIISFFKKVKINEILELEEKYPELREKLRSSYDYQDKKKQGCPCFGFTCYENNE